MSKIDSVVFIGGGRVARVLLEGWERSGEVPGRVCVVEPDKTALGRLQEVAPEVREASSGDVGCCDLIFLAVHPPMMEPAMKALAGETASEALVVSLVPKIRISAIAEALGTERVVRIIPNAPSAIGAGYNPVCFGDAIDPETKEALIALFAPWGEQPEVAEEDLEAYAVVSAMGPTYFWYQIQMLRDLGVSFGLRQEAADEAIARMLDGAVRCLLERGPESMDLIPVRPLQDLEPAVKNAYEEKLRGVFGKLTASATASDR